MTIAVSHDYGELIVAVPVSCTVNGVAAHYHCSVCGKYFDEDKNEIEEASLVIPAGHDYGELIPENQDHAAATMSRKIRKSHAAMDWNCDADSLARKIRAFYPWPSVIFGVLRGDRMATVKITSGKPVPGSGSPGEILSIDPSGITVACSSGALLLEKVIPEGKKEMRGVDFANGFRLEPGMIFLNGPGSSAT